MILKLGWKKIGKLIPYRRTKVNVLIRNHIYYMTPAICKAARALTGLTQRELAEASDIATPTIADFERGARKPHLNNLKAMTLAFEKLGVSFVIDGKRIVAIDFRNLDVVAEEAIDVGSQKNHAV